MTSDCEHDQLSEAAQNLKRSHEQEDQQLNEQPSRSNDSEQSQSPAGHSSDRDPVLPTEDVPPPLPTEELPPPLPSGEAPPPLPSENVPGTASEDDGWEPVWDEATQAYYFYNSKSGVTQWENPRVADTITEAEPQQRPHGGYDPAIHGDYDPNAPYALEARAREEAARLAATAGKPSVEPDYGAAGHFNRFTGKWQSESQRAENYSDEAKSKRQMNAFFDVDAAANSHSGKSLKAERANKKLSKQELKAFKEKRKEKKEEKRRAWLRD